MTLCDEILNLVEGEDRRKSKEADYMLGGIDRGRKPDGTLGNRRKPYGVSGKHQKAKFDKMQTQLDALG